MSTATEIRGDVAAIKPMSIALRRELHQHPELAFEEIWTAARLAKHLRDLGLAVSEGIGGTGVLGILDGTGPGATVLLRADMDAVDMEETTGAAYTSLNPGRNHCCGHDINSAVVASVASVLAGRRGEFSGRVAFLFQPGDEPMRGVQRMIDDGLWSRVAPDAVLSLHVEPFVNVGQAVVQSGRIWASRDAQVYNLTIPTPRFVPSGARPPVVDAVRLAMEIATALYDFVEEGQSPDPVTFRVRTLKAEQGAFGADGHAQLEYNLNLYDNALRDRLMKGIDARVREMAAAAGATVDVTVDFALPTLVNDERVAAALERAANDVIGPSNVVRGWRNTFADDLSLLFARAPGCVLLLGTRNEAKGITQVWHTSAFDIDEEALPIGVHLLAAAALDLLGEAR